MIALMRKLFGRPRQVSTPAQGTAQGTATANVVLYTTMFCPFCMRAKRLLDAKGVSFTEIDVGMDSAKRQEMLTRAGGRDTVPQIFIGDRHIGGSDELVALEHAGELNQLLEEAA